MRNSQFIWAVANTFSAFGGDAIAVVGDVAVPSDVERAIAQGEEAFGYVNVLYNNAGIMPDEDESVLMLDEDVWRRVLDVNAKGVALCCQYGIPALMQAGRTVVAASAASGILLS